MNKSTSFLLLILTFLSLGLPNSFAQQNIQKHSLVPDPNFPTQTGQKDYPGTTMAWSSPNPDQPPVYLHFSMNYHHGENNVVGMSGDAVYWGMKPTGAGKADSYVLVRELFFYKLNETGLTRVFRKDIPEEALVNARHRWAPDPAPGTAETPHDLKKVVADPNLPVMNSYQDNNGMSYAGTRKYPESILAWITNDANIPPNTIQFAQTEDPGFFSGEGIYLGMKWTGPNTADTYVDLGGYGIVKINNWEIVKVPKAELPAQLYNTHQQILEARKQAYQKHTDDATAEQKRVADQAHFTPEGEVLILAPNAKLSPKKETPGIFILVYTDPKTNQSVTVQLKRVIGTKDQAAINKYPPAQKKQMMDILNTMATGGYFVKVPLAANAKTYHSYTIGAQGELIIHPEKNITEKLADADWPDDWPTQVR